SRFSPAPRSCCMRSCRPTRGCSPRSSLWSSGSRCWRQSRRGSSRGAPNEVDPTRVEVPQQLRLPELAALVQLGEEVVEGLSAERVDDDERSSRLWAVEQSGP